MELLDKIRKAGKVEYKGLCGDLENKPSYVYKGIWYIFEPDTTPESAVKEICNLTNADFEELTNPYYGLSYNQTIAAMVKDKLLDAGFTQPLIDAITINYTLAKLKELAGEELNADDNRKLSEGSQLEGLRQQFIIEAYEEFNQAFIGYAYGYGYNMENDYYAIMGEAA